MFKSNVLKKFRVDNFLFFVLSLWIFLSLYLTFSNPTIGISDMFWFIERANTLSLHSSKYWVDGFYPLGYPVLLKIISNIFGDYLIGGRIISLFSGMIGVIFIYLITKEIFGNFSSKIATLLLILNPFYLKFSTISSTDIPSASFLILATYLFILYLKKREGKFLFLSGVALGFSYMIRYTALTVLPVFIIFSFLSVDENRFMTGYKSILKFLGGFFLISFPQLMLSMIYKGNPFYNLQAQNVYFGIFGNKNWGLHMDEARKITGIFQIVRKYPLPFFNNWGLNLIHSFKIEFLKFFPFLLSPFGIYFSFKREFKKSLFLFLIFIFFTFSISMAFPSGRLLLPSLMILSIFSGVAFGKILKFKMKEVALILIFLFTFYSYIFPILKNPISKFDKIKIEVSKVLHKNGMKKADEVLSFSFEYYDLKRKTKDRFKIPWYYQGFKGFKSLKDIYDFMRKDGEKFFLFDRNAPYTVKGVRGFWPFKKKELKRYFTFIATIEGFAFIYKIKGAMQQ